MIQTHNHGYIQSETKTSPPDVIWPLGVMVAGGSRSGKKEFLSKARLEADRDPGTPFDGGFNRKPSLK